MRGWGGGGLGNAPGRVQETGQMKELTTGRKERDRKFRTRDAESHWQKDRVASGVREGSSGAVTHALSLCS